LEAFGFRTRKKQKSEILENLQKSEEKKEKKSERKGTYLMTTAGQDPACYFEGP